MVRGLTRSFACVWQSEVQKAESKKNLLRNTQGVHAAMRLNMEQTILSQYRRLPGFHSEFMGLEIMQDSMTRVGVEDVLNGALLHSLLVLAKCSVSRCHEERRTRHRTA